MGRALKGEELDVFTERFIDGGEVDRRAVADLLSFMRKHYEEFILPEEESVWQPRGFDEQMYREECTMIGRIVDHLADGREGQLSLYTGDQEVMATRWVKKADFAYHEEVILAPYTLLPIASCDHTIAKIRHRPQRGVVDNRVDVNMRNLAKSVYYGGDLVIQPSYPWILRALGSGAFAAGEDL
jgi:hypothetical protein